MITLSLIHILDGKFTHEWLDNVEKALAGRKPDYLVVQHMEPDHSANIQNFMKAYPEAVIVANAKTFCMVGNFFRSMDLESRTLEVKNGDSLSLGKHVLNFVFAPMVHWPEVMVTYDSTDVYKRQTAGALSVMGVLVRMFMGMSMFVAVFMSAAAGAMPVVGVLVGMFMGMSVFVVVFMSAAAGALPVMGMLMTMLMGMFLLMYVLVAAAAPLMAAAVFCRIFRSVQMFVFFHNYALRMSFFRLVRINI